MAVTGLLAAGLVAGSCDAGGGRYVLVTGGQTGVYYPVGQAIARLLHDGDSGIRMDVRPSGGSQDNARQLGRGDADFALIQNDFAVHATRGEQMFDGEPIANLRGVAALYPEQVHIVARADAGITSVADLAGKRVSTGDAGSGTEGNARHILAAYGLSESDLGQQERLGAAQSADYLQDGRLDAMFFTVGVGAAAIQQVTTQPGLDVVFVPVDGEQREALLDQYPYYTAAAIPADAYGAGEPGEDVPAVSVVASLVTTAEVSEEAVAAVLSAMFDNLDAFRGSHGRLREFNRADAEADLPIELHAGAAAFYANDE
ncbi:MAG: TAXI family TRAP transporter solute-binding subunit [Phycisphaeraceae bacterium]